MRLLTCEQLSFAHERRCCHLCLLLVSPRHMHGSVGHLSLLHLFHILVVLLQYLVCKGSVVVLDVHTRGNSLGHIQLVEELIAQLLVSSPQMPRTYTS